MRRQMQGGVLESEELRAESEEENRQQQGRFLFSSEL